ncbi:MAG: CopG family transcriptional regulator [Nitrospiraceae bacterium]|nr:MAG: CopG family transcriptional regulator [Nitrospiraceae bacterium]
MSVSLTNALKSYVRRKVASGQYESASEVVRQSLRMMQEQERRENLFWSGVRRKVKGARKSITNGNVVDGRAAMAALIASLNTDGRKRIKNRA